MAVVKDGRVGFRLDDGRMLDMTAGDPQLRHIDRAWASTVHAFQGRTVDTAISAIEANHPNLTNRKMLYVEISRARDRAELVTDDKAALREQLQALTGERIAALEAVGEAKAKAPEGTVNLMAAGERFSPIAFVKRPLLLPAIPPWLRCEIGEASGGKSGGAGR